MRIGEWSGVNVDSLQFCWDALMKAEGDQCELEIEFLPTPEPVSRMRMGFSGGKPPGGMPALRLQKDSASQRAPN